MKERTAVVVLPEGFQSLGLIRRNLAKTGSIVWARSVYVTEPVIGILHPAMRGFLLMAARRHLSGQMHPVIVVEGDDVIRRVVQLVGEHVNPELCSEASLRFQLWKDRDVFEPWRLEDGKIYYRDFILRPETPAEACAYIAALTDPSLQSCPL